MKRILFVMLVAIAALQSWGQIKLTPQQQIQILDKIEKSSSAMTSMQERQQTALAVHLAL